MTCCRYPQDLSVDWDIGFTGSVRYGGGLIVSGGDGGSDI